MYVFNKRRIKSPKKQGKFILKIPMSMIFIDEQGQGFEYINGQFIYRFSTYFSKAKTSLSL